ncbi:TetR family transcriptional regulator [Mycobacterium sp. Y57]|uniref:TetR/AcrR family transcriptional regulator n=1 Tax=Mycolicibacterium xanthum TaxID=2796469 RepID=UPI001C85E72C|nr:TetR family transcriptional regulator [Mycolicibacterium xanthum]MBX7431906.1 TetR family transcriptional regulator [Mycolicibacterium xanthum]
MSRPLRHVTKHPGRRPGPNTTRELIADTARKHFAELGYDRTSMRQVALAAEVDPALVAHYFGTKLDLFLAVVELPIDPAALIDRVVGGGSECAGTRLATAVLDVLDDEVRRRPMVGMIRAATAEPEAARFVRDFLTRNLLLPIAERLEADHPEYRAGLVMSQIVGFTLARYIVGIAPLATHPRELVAADLGATLQRYLLGELSR